MKTLLDSLCYTFEQWKPFNVIFIFISKHFLPNFVCSKEKAHANSFGCCCINFEIRDILFLGFGVNFLHSGHKFLNKSVVKNRLSLFGERVLMNSINKWMSLKPNSQQIHKNILTIKIRLIKDKCLSPPLLS